MKILHIKENLCKFIDDYFIINYKIEDNPTHAEIVMANHRASHILNEI